MKVTKSMPLLRAKNIFEHLDRWNYENAYWNTSMTVE